MATTVILVQHRDGSKASGVRVTLSFSGILSGMSSPVLTDRDGRAMISHTSTGEATVYVDGKDRGRVRTPGQFAFTL